MIHKIKALYNEGQGLSLRQIAKELGISRNSVKKYLALDAEAISASRGDSDRTKRLDKYQDYIIHLLKTYPGLSAVKVYRKLQEKDSGLEISSRIFLETSEEGVAPLF